MNRLFLLIVISCIFSIVAMGQLINRTYFYRSELSDMRLACIGEHPDSLIGSYVLYDTTGSRHIASLELFSNGSFECSNYFGAGMTSYGHWDMLDSTHLNLNTGSHQIEIEEMYVENTVTPGKYHLYCLEEVRKGFFNRLSGCELFVGLDGQRRKIRSDKKGELIVKFDKRIDFITIISDEHYLANNCYTVKNPQWSNVFIIKCSKCLQFDNVQWTFIRENQWHSIDSIQYKGYVIEKRR